MISIVVVDDHQMVRQSIVSLLDTVSDFEVAGEASNGHEALAMIREKRPDAALVDIAMPRLNGLETTRRIQAMAVDTCVIILSMYSDERIMRQAFENGAKGYLLKSSVIDDLLHAIRTVVKDEIYMSPSIERSATDGNLRTGSATESELSLEGLSNREREILQLVAEGHTNKSVGEVLCIDIKTVEKHRAALIKKLGARGISDLIQVALKHHLVFLDDF